MSEKFRNKYRIPSARLLNWDYSSNGYYFLTICTRERINYYWKINNKQRELSPCGIIVNKFWKEIPNHFPFVILDEFVVMPDHIHGILVINKSNKYVETPNLGVSTKLTPGVSTKLTPGVSTIINQYKRICTIKIRNMGISFAWQTRFYDQIIRNEASLNKIRQYIKSNPFSWKGNNVNPMPG